VKFNFTIHIKVKEKLLRKYKANAKKLDCDSLSEYVRLLLSLPIDEVKRIIKERGL
jgi:hypothetical protein